MYDFLRPLFQLAGILAAAFVIVAFATQLETVLGLDAFANDLMAELQKATAAK